MYICMLMRDEKEERKKQARSNKQQSKATQYTQSSHFSKIKMSYMYMYMLLASFFLPSLLSLKHVYMAHV